MENTPGRNPTKATNLKPHPGQKLYVGHYIVELAVSAVLYVCEWRDVMRIKETVCIAERMGLSTVCMKYHRNIISVFMYIFHCNI